MKSGKRLTTDRKIGICIVRRLFMIRAIGPSKCPSCRVSKELAKLRGMASAYSNTFLNLFSTLDGIWLILDRGVRYAEGVKCWRILLKCFFPFDLLDRVSAQNILADTWNWPYLGIYDWKNLLTCSLNFSSLLSSQASDILEYCPILHTWHIKPHIIPKIVNNIVIDVVNIVLFFM